MQLLRGCSYHVTAARATLEDRFHPNAFNAIVRLDLIT